MPLEFSNRSGDKYLGNSNRRESWAKESGRMLHDWKHRVSKYKSSHAIVTPCSCPALSYYAAMQLSTAWTTCAMHHAYLDETLWVENIEVCLYSEIKFINLNKVKYAICTEAAQIAIFFWRANSLAIMYILAASKVTCICSQQDLPGWSIGVLRKLVLY